MAAWSRAPAERRQAPLSASIRLTRCRPLAAICPLSAGMLEAGGFDQRTRTMTPFRQGCNCRSPNGAMCLVFQTEPLTEDCRSHRARSTVHLYVSSSAVDTDFTAKLIDVYPPNPDYPLGFDLNIGDSITRMRYRDSLGKGGADEAGQGLSSRRFISTRRPMFSPRGTGSGWISPAAISHASTLIPNRENPPAASAMVPADNQVLHKDAEASYVLLPIIPP